MSNWVFILYWQSTPCISWFILNIWFSKSYEQLRSSLSWCSGDKTLNYRDDEFLPKYKFCQYHHSCFMDGWYTIKNNSILWSHSWIFLPFQAESAVLTVPLQRWHDLENSWCKIIPTDRNVVMGLHNRRTSCEIVIHNHDKGFHCPWG